ncbi:MAG: sulfotransferase family protein [Arenicellales bacterium]
MLEILYTIYYLWNKGPQVQTDGINRRYTIVYIHGAGHCGSTLLNLLLNAHSNVIGLSEISTLHKAFMDNKFGSESAELSKTKFWRSILNEFEQRSGTSLLEESNRFRLLDWQQYFSLDPDEVSHIQKVDRTFFDSIAEQIDTSIICDASKFLVRLHMLVSSGLPAKVVHLDRDGRGVTHSYLRKGHSFKNAFRRWSIGATGYILLSHWLPKNDLHYCRYEDLARHPEKELEKICAFLGINFENEMLVDFRNTENFGICGNRMRNSKDTNILVDNSWKQQLPLKTKIKFWLSGGWIQWPIRLWAAIRERS